MSTGQPLERPRVRPVTLLVAALVALLLNALAVLAYPHLVGRGAGAPVLAVVGCTGIVAGIVTLAAPVAAIVVRMAR